MPPENPNLLQKRNTVATALPGVKRRKRRRLPRYCVKANPLARVLGLSPRTIRALDAAGKLPAPIRLNGSVLWFIPEIRDWLEAGAPDRDRWEAMKKSRK